MLSSVDALVLSEVYPAGEVPIPGADAKALARAIRARGRSEPVVVGQVASLIEVLPDVLQEGGFAVDDGCWRYWFHRAANCS